MIAPRVFISFDFDNDLSQGMLFFRQTEDSCTPLNLQGWSSKALLPQTEWEKLLCEKIAACNILVVLAGKKTASATGVVKEIAIAAKANVPVLGVYVDGARASTLLPIGLERSQTIAWDWDNIASKVNQLMAEGKNKT